MDEQTRFPNALAVADQHICLPIGEGMYSDMSAYEVEDFLIGEKSE